MGQVRHGSATTTHAVRAAIQRSQASTAALSRELGINPKTVAKWRKRETVEDHKTGPKEPRSSVFCEEEEAMVVAFRRHTLLPLDDCLYALGLIDLVEPFVFRARLQARTAKTIFSRHRQGEVHVFSSSPCSVA